MSAGNARRPKVSIRRKDGLALLAECPSVDIAEASASWGIRNPLDVPWVRHDLYDLNGALGGGYEAICRCAVDMRVGFSEPMDLPTVKSPTPQRVRMEPHEKPASIAFVGQCPACGTVHWGVFFK